MCGRQRALIGRLHGDYQVGAIGHHHVGDLIQGLASHLDAVHLDHLVVDSQQASAFGQSARHQTGYKDARLLLQSAGRHPHRGAIPYVESQGLVAAVLQQPHSPMRLRHYIHIYNGRNLPEIVRYGYRRGLCLHGRVAHQYAADQIPRFHRPKARVLI